MKHLNPRQGITTPTWKFIQPVAADVLGVKHLNPRQGITTHRHHSMRSRRPVPTCETPKSPPGDYNVGDVVFV